MEIRMKEHKTPVLGNSVGALSSMKGRAVGRVRFGYFQVRQEGWRRSRLY